MSKKIRVSPHITFIIEQSISSKSICVIQKEESRLLYLQTLTKDEKYVICQGLKIHKTSREQVCLCYFNMTRLISFFFFFEILLPVLGYRWQEEIITKNIR